MKRFSIQLIIYLISALFVIPSIHAQRQYDKKKFHEYFDQGNLLILEQFYDTALHTFLVLHKMDSANANVNYKIGFLYLKTSSEKAKAIPFLGNAIKNVSKNYVEFEPSEKHAPGLAYYYLAIAYHLSYKFDESNALLEKYKAMIPKKAEDVHADINHRMEMNETGKELVSNPTPCIVDNLGDSVNSPFADYSSVISADESTLMFTSRRKGKGGEDNKTLDDKYFEDIWVCTKRQEGTWSEAEPIGGAINTLDNEATIGLSADGQQLFIYKDVQGDGGIYQSTLEGDSWSSPEKVGEGGPSDINKTSSWEPSACITADGNTLYFVSDRKGGFGGRDIYKCLKLPTGKWGLAINLGGIINTPYDEDAPFIHPDQKTLFFSSSGHKTMGGFDIFFAQKTDTGWSSPQNMGYPVNTTDDDIFYVMSTDGKRGYFSSVRAGGKGEKDIYMVTVPKTIVDPVALIVGIIKNANSEPINPSTTILVTSAATGEVVEYRPNVNTGKFILSLVPGNEYQVSVQVDGIEAYTTVVKPQENFNETDKETLLKTIVLERHKTAPTGEDTTKIVIANKKLVVSGALVNHSGKPMAYKTVKLIYKEVAVDTSVTYGVGYFMFTNIEKGKDYIVAVNDKDENIGKELKVKVTYENGEELKVKKLPSAQGRKFQVTGTKTTFTIIGDAEAGPVVSENANRNPTAIAANTFDLNAAYAKYFSYNKSDIDAADKKFAELIEKIAGEINKKGACSIYIESGASRVPTKKLYKTNSQLAIARKNVAHAEIISALKSKNIPTQNIKITYKAQVQGPHYRNDYIENRVEYEKYQYVKVFFN